MLLRLSRLAALAFAVFALPAAALAQTWPTRPVTMVIPFAAGGPTDVLGRVMAEQMSQILGQQVVVENVGGAGGMTGTARISRGSNDGYQFVLGTVGTHAVNQTLYKSPLYNAATDFAPVTLIADVPLILIVRKDLPVSNLQEFIAYTKANQAKMQFASAGTGSAVHLGCLLLNAAIGTNVTHVPYRGSAPAIQDLIGGRVDFMCEIASTGLAHIQGGSVKALATLTATRAAVLPDLPTAQEQGLAGFEAYTWNAFFMHKDTPPEIVERLRQVTIQAMDTPAVRDRLTGLGAIMAAPERRGGPYLERFVRSEIDKWAAPIRASGVSE
ncbi:Bug family tripartite tricarboxylate transporter substrate binding protein [Phreatobacter sp. AB_2022a]|uniref:Bug family tripartite tricarboxylate transporter substrate binding protein n=1 Tax=Phreatobacter sp. AB_2022a TaxID=3003134 RepID=UPI000571D627|nr:tripartite tricarboxylate transporter substrate-binding protein [Phreatobacter sp. AB_2022a]MCZ0733740.1 tripartite tricarboxylate transporter substrate-binding protein [Phreatobacter sp. AB_2022a]CEJ09996.1 Tripartite tricarboxylate transporter family receptor [bacterium YEK0313]